MPVRTFSLNSREFYEAVCPPEDRPWIPNGALPREPRWPRPTEGALVSAEDDEAAADAFREWQAHLQAGRLGAATES